MSKPHKHAALIKKWADGAVIQFQSYGSSGQWMDCGDGDPSWAEEVNYREKPTTLPYRLCTFRNSDGSLRLGVANDEFRVKMFESDKINFDEWIHTEWQMIEVPHSQESNK